jgi:hypothetical protein
MASPVRTPSAGSLVTGIRDELVNAVAMSSRRVELASPFLSAPVADSLALALLSSTAPRVRLLTCLDPRAVAVGALSLEGIASMMRAGVEVRTLSDLHAKVILVDDALAVVGSGNLTGKGLGGGPGDNVELGVVLRADQREVAQKLIRSWWRAGEPVGDAELRRCREQAARIQVPKTLPPAQGPRLTTGERTSTTYGRRRGGSTGVWLTMLYYVNGEHRWRQRDWVSSVHRFAEDGRPLLRPSFVPGDLVVVYAVGPQRCPAILQVADETTFDPDLVAREAGPDDAARWGWVTPVRALRQVPIRRAPTLDQIGVKSASVRQKGHISLSLDQYRLAYRHIARPRGKRQ